MVVGGVGVVVDVDGHELAVDDVDEGAASRDDVVLVPVIDFDVATEGGSVADVAYKGRALDDLPSPGEDSERCVFGVELAGVDEGSGVDWKPEVGLGAGHHPVEIDSDRRGRGAMGCRSGCGIECRCRRRIRL